jgi:hypothetical protein
VEDFGALAVDPEVCIPLRCSPLPVGRPPDIGRGPEPIPLECVPLAGAFAPFFSAHAGQNIFSPTVTASSLSTRTLQPSQ